MTCVTEERRRGVPGNSEERCQGVPWKQHAGAVCAGHGVSTLCTREFLED